MQVPPLTRRTIDVKTVPGMALAPSFSTILESDVEVVADRTMSWDAAGYGSHAETVDQGTGPDLVSRRRRDAERAPALLRDREPEPGPGRCHGDLPAACAEPADSTIVYPAIPAYTRKTIYVNGEDPRLVSGDVSGVVTSTAGGPIIVERAMYLNNENTQFNAGHCQRRCYVADD